MYTVIRLNAYGAIMYLLVKDNVCKLVFDNLFNVESYCKQFNIKYTYEERSIQ